MTIRYPDLVWAGPLAASKPLGATTCPPAVAEPDGATPCPHSVAGMRSGTNGWVRTRADALTPKSPRHDPEPALPAYGRYRASPDEVPEATDIDVPDEDPVDDFKISAPRGSVSCSRQQREEKEEYMKGARRGVLPGAHVEEPRCSCLDIQQEMDVAALKAHQKRRREPRSTSRPAFMVFNVVDAAVVGRPEGHQPPHVRW